MQTLWDYQDEQNKQEQDKNPVQEAIEKEQAIEKERQDILDNVSSFVVDTTRDKTAWILNHYPEARDSDITLQLRYWETFEGNVYNGHSITPEDYYKLTPLTTLTRAKIQNEYKLFLARPEVRERRGTLSEEEKQKAIQDKPNYPVFTVYMDDSGKNADFLIIGSVGF